MTPRADLIIENAISTFGPPMASAEQANQRIKEVLARGKIPRGTERKRERERKRKREREREPTVLCSEVCGSR
jgi:hypothetical protein